MPVPCGRVVTGGEGHSEDVVAPRCGLVLEDPDPEVPAGVVEDDLVAAEAVRCRGQRVERVDQGPSRAVVGATAGEPVSGDEDVVVGCRDGRLVDGTGQDAGGVVAEADVLDEADLSQIGRTDNTIAIGAADSPPMATQPAGADTNIKTNDGRPGPGNRRTHAGKPAGAAPRQPSTSRGNAVGPRRSAPPNPPGMNPALR